MIEIINLSKSFNQHQVLDNLNLTITTGETKVIIGRSGCGKSVLLKHIIGLLKPEAGQVIIDGEDITKMNEKELSRIRLKFGMLFQGAALFDSLNVGENVGFTLREHSDFSETEIHKRVKESLALVGLKEIEELMPAELSGGMRKRVGLARALALDPEIVLFDEPTSGLDPVMADTVDNLIEQTQKDLGITFVVISHDIASTFKIAHNIGMIYEGRLIEYGPKEKVRNSQNPILRQFFSRQAEGPMQVV
jgi:phospholipid/cholesterol/gamma-HCH transport system ATP-binding protein